MNTSRVITVTHKTNAGVVSRSFCVEKDFLNLETFKAYSTQAMGLRYQIEAHSFDVLELGQKLILHPQVNNYEAIVLNSNNGQKEIKANESLKIKLVTEYFYKNFMYDEISGILNKKHGINISVRSLKRLLQKLKLRRKNLQEDPLEKIVSAIMQEVHSVGRNLGYRSMWRRLHSSYGIQVKSKTVLKILKIADPEGVASRLRHRLKRREYSAPGPNFIFHVDGNDKLKKEGFAIHACIDGFSKKIIWLRVGRSNNNPKIIAGYFLDAIAELGIVPTLLRSDRGTENTMVELLQMTLRSSHGDELAGEKSYLSGKSTANQRIEHYWCILRHQLLDCYRDYFKAMRHRFILDISDSLHIELLRFCFGYLIQNSLNVIKNEWNDHRIRKQNNRNISGNIPNIMYYWPEKYNSKDYGKPVNVLGIQELYEEFSVKSTLYNDDIEIFVKEVMPHFVKPTSCEEAERLFITLVNAASEL